MSAENGVLAETGVGLLKEIADCPPRFKMEIWNCGRNMIFLPKFDSAILAFSKLRLSQRNQCGIGCKFPKRCISLQDRDTAQWQLNDIATYINYFTLILSKKVIIIFYYASILVYIVWISIIFCMCNIFNDVYYIVYLMINLSRSY